MSKNLKLKKVNKSFVPEPMSYFSYSYMYTRMNIMNVFLPIRIWVVFLDLYATLVESSKDWQGGGFGYKWTYVDHPN